MGRGWVDSLTGTHYEVVIRCPPELLLPSLDLELTILASLASQQAPGLVLGLGRASPHPAFDVAAWDSNHDLMVLQEALYPRH